jgi:NADH:ubiquinone oxidoreductase subunit 5 (subunit L)/multisubunit Na+/H+ antiporter MnhA subunit
MVELIQFFAYIPLLGFALSVLQKKKHEKSLAAILITTAAAQFLLLCYMIFHWLRAGIPKLDIRQFTILDTPQFDFYIDFYFDKTSAIFLLVGTILTLLVSVFSKYYIHREEGYKRYFNNIQLFFFGFSLLIVSGNFETLFIGWEMVGISSFLLISFYRDRYLPVKNAMKVVSLYRLGDVFLILAMWFNHHLWHSNISFSQLDDSLAVITKINEHYFLAIMIGLALFLGAAVKSAIFPFSSWVSRAMEGPSSSSAIFYGSLSIHLGIFLLLRTYSFWEHLTILKVVIIVFGAITCITSNTIASTQPAVKTKIAYASITQIGLIAIEIALGWHNLALLHFAGNAFLRAYQILVSPSVLGYLIHNQLFHFIPRKEGSQNRLLNSLYMLSIKEYNMDLAHYHYLWKPFKKFGTVLGKMNQKLTLAFVISVFVWGIFLDINTGLFEEWVLDTFAILYSIISLLFILSSFSERASGKNAWNKVIVGHLFITLSISVNSHIPFQYLMLYLGCIAFFGVLGLLSLLNLEKTEKDISLHQYHGNSYEYSGAAVVFLISCLGLVGFPISPLYVGLDLLLTYIESHQYLLIGFTALSLLFIEISLLRIYTRLFCGQHKKTHHPIAFKSS